MKKKYTRLFLIGLVAAFLIRGFLLPWGNHWDILAHSEWSERLYFYGPSNFYESRTWLYTRPTQLPLINLAYGFNQELYKNVAWLIHAIGLQDLENWFTAELVDNQFSYGQMIFMKLFLVFADLIIAALIFLLGSNRVGEKKSLITALIYLFTPYTFYISALWGQSDQISALFLLLAFLALYIKNGASFKYPNLFFPLSVFLIFVAIEVKPLAIFITPFYVFYFLKTRPTLATTLLSIGVGLWLFLITTAPFAKGNSLIYFTRTILPLVFDQGRYFTSSHVFNFWAFVSPFDKSSLHYTLLGVSAISWGYFFLVLLNILAIFIIDKKDNLKNLILCLFIINGGYFIFFTGMYERYYFTGMLFFLILTMFFKKIFFFWLFSGLLFTVNLIISWGYPVDYPEVWSNYNLVRSLSFLQLLFFITTVIICIKATYQNKLHG